MRRRFSRLIVTLLMTSAVTAVGYAKANLPRPTRYVEDYANVITAPQQGIAESKARTGQLAD